MPLLKNGTNLEVNVLYQSSIGSFATSIKTTAGLFLAAALETAVTDKRELTSTCARAHTHTHVYTHTHTARLPLTQEVPFPSPLNNEQAQLSGPVRKQPLNCALVIKAEVTEKEKTEKRKKPWKAVSWCTESSHDSSEQHTDIHTHSPQTSTLTAHRHPHSQPTDIHTHSPQTSTLTAHGLFLKPAALVL
ncbi:hypothetical protein ANANG_G00176370 [Anguilla anguilla]|uniref:Uncharacterized protein n=1 Tax=Anguilla anguilla TaxID=7936 RepID=A0A9D3M7Q0_ANGAN|nr:hypothetical protein ANANG_G00176370 [Anguilla anguilla]